MRHKRKLSFGKIEFADLQTFVQITPSPEVKVFDKWFSFQYSLSKAEKLFLEKIYQSNRLLIDTYSEEELKAKIIIPIINQVDFTQDNVRDWYERPLKAVVNGVLLTGKTDFMVATGFDKPQKPFFFIQEYKKALGDKHPQNALLAAMMTALELNQTQEMKGAFVIGKSWQFVILKKLSEQHYTFFISRDFSIITLPELQQIYSNLQAVKAAIFGK